MIELLLKGFVAGLIITAPVGPVGALFIKRIFTKGGRAGLLMGYGSATADTLFAIFAGFSVSIISGFVSEHKGLFGLFAALIILVIGFREWFLAGKTKVKKRLIKRNMAGNFLAGFVITIINPMTLLSFIAAYTLMGVTLSHHFLSTFLVVLGSSLGAIFGWTTLSLILVRTKRKVNTKALIYINNFSGPLLILFGLLLAIKSIHLI